MLDGTRDVPWGQADFLPCVSDSRNQLRWSSLGNMHTPKTGILPTREMPASWYKLTQRKELPLRVCLLHRGTELGDRRKAVRSPPRRWPDLHSPQGSPQSLRNHSQCPSKSESHHCAGCYLQKVLEGLGYNFRLTKYMIFPWAHVPPSLSVSVTGSCPQGAFLAELIWNPGASSAITGEGWECAVERQAGPQIFMRRGSSVTQPQLDSWLPGTWWLTHLPPRTDWDGILSHSLYRSFHFVDWGWLPCRHLPWNSPIIMVTPWLTYCSLCLRVLKVHMHVDQSLLKSKPPASCLLL